MMVSKYAAYGPTLGDDSSSVPLTYFAGVSSSGALLRGRSGKRHGLRVTNGRLLRGRELRPEYRMDWDNSDALDNLANFAGRNATGNCHGKRNARDDGREHFYGSRNFKSGITHCGYRSRGTVLSGCPQMTDWTVEYPVYRSTYAARGRDTVTVECMTALEAEDLASTIPGSRVLFHGQFWMPGGHKSSLAFGGKAEYRVKGATV